MSIDKQGGKIAFVCDVCSAPFEAEATDQRPGKVHELWIGGHITGLNAFGAAIFHGPLMLHHQPHIVTQAAPKNRVSQVTPSMI